jgi:PAS domain S-box-containing protein
MPPERSSEEELDFLNLIMDNIHNGVMITDADGYVTHFNATYGHFLGVEPREQIGRHCLEVVENSRMHIVAQTGVPEINESHRIQGQKMVVQRIPIKKDGKIIAVFGQVMFKDVADVGKLAKQLALLESKVEVYERELISLRSTRYTIDSIVGGGGITAALKKEALNAAATNLPVLISGESGTGKELFAQAIHHASTRRLNPFVRINCSAIPKDLLESELFGYSPGAFTGAFHKGKPGKFEVAHRGTIFLDEIGDLPKEMQPKLLRVLEEKEVERLGATSVVRVDFRLVAATNQDLEKMVAEGRFRRDLFYRLNVIPLKIPPLRERKEDVIPIARHIVGQIMHDAPGTEILLHSEAEDTLLQHEWPGNVRELSNLLERVAHSLRGNTIYAHHLPFAPKGTSRPALWEGKYSLKAVMEQAEREAIFHALSMSEQNKAQAAKLLGIHRTHLYKKLRKYDPAACHDVSSDV